MSTFGRWWRKPGREAENSERRPFVGIPAPVNEKHARKAEGASGLVIRLPDGIEIQVEEQTAPELLRRVLRIPGTPRCSSTGGV